jgi:sugar lactone lactonase YvrE
MRLLPVVLLVLIAPFAAFGQSYTISTFAGGGLPENIPGTSAVLGLPTSVAVDGSGNLYFADANLCVVLRLDAVTGNLTLVAGNGTRGFSGDKGPATSAQLNSPQSVAVDFHGYVYIADTSNYRVRMVANGVITTVAGNGASGGTGGSYGPATNYPMNANAIAVDPLGNLYILDTAHGVMTRVSNGVINLISGSQFLNPTALATDSSGNWYVADTGNSRIVSSASLSNGVPSTYPGSAGLVATGIAVGPGGIVYVAEGNSQIIQTISNGAPPVVATVAGSGTAGFSGDGEPAINAELDNPQSVAVDSLGNLYIADRKNLRVRRVSSGNITTVAGGGSSIGDNGPAAAAQLGGPLGVSTGPDGAIYFADNYNNRVRKVSNGVITTVAGSGVAGYGGDNGPATSALLDQPWGAAADSSGNVYIADWAANHIRKVSNGVITTLVQARNSLSCDGTGVVKPWGIYSDPAGVLYIAEQSSNWQEWSNGVLTCPPGGGAQGFAEDSKGNLYMSGAGPGLGAGGGIVYNMSTGGYSAAGTGVPGFSGDNGPATAAQIDAFGIAVDKAGSLYIADVNNNRIRKVTNGVITTIAGNGAPGFGGDNGPATSAMLSAPYNVAVDSAGNVYIADNGNNRIRILKPSQTITFLPLNSVTLISPPFPVSATASSGLPVSFASNTPGVCTVSGDEVTMAGAGTCSITASQPGNSTWPAATPVTQTFTVSAGPAVLSFSPSSGAGTSVTFEAVYYDQSGAADMNVLLLQVNTSQSSANACYVYYEPQGNHLYLANNAGTFTTAALTPGVAGTASNSQCTLNAGSSSVGAIGDTLGTVIALTFNSTFVGAKNVYLYAAGSGGKNSGWVKEGTWTVPSPNPPLIVSLSPSAGNGTSVTFQAVYSDPNGASDLSTVLLQVNAGQSSANACYVYYQPQGNHLYLANNAGTLWMTPALTPGGAGTASNTQCTLNAASSSVTTAGNNLTLNVALSFSGTVSGSQNVYLYAAGLSGQNSGWVKKGTWTPNLVAGSPAIVSLSETSGAAGEVTFQAVYSDPNGAGDLREILFQMNAYQGSANACYVYYQPQGNHLYLADNAGTAWIPPALTPGVNGTATTATNSQCSLIGVYSSVTTVGNDLTLSIALVFSDTFVGVKNVYLYAAGLSGLNSGWVKAGSWTP